MKIAFISDIHGSAYYCQEALEQIDNWAADKIVVLGDVMYHGPRNPLPREYDPQRVAALLNERKERIIAVRGNCDSEVDQMLLEFPMMADYALLSTPEHTFFLTHGHIYNPENHPELANGSVFAFGHIHTVVAEQKNNVFYFNPSSVSLPKDQGLHSWGRYEEAVLEVVELSGNVIKRLEI